MELLLLYFFTALFINIQWNKHEGFDYYNPIEDWNESEWLAVIFVTVIFPVSWLFWFRWMWPSLVKERKFQKNN
jgi:hypothetical protein